MPRHRQATAHSPSHATASYTGPTLELVKGKPPVRRWSAPPPSWVFGVTDRRGNTLPAQVAHLLAYYWTRADAPSKRPDGGPTFLRAVWRLDHATVADELGIKERTVKRWFGTLVDAGLVRRGECLVEGRMESGIWLADLDVGRFAEAQLKLPLQNLALVRRGYNVDPSPAKPTRYNLDPLAWQSVSLDFDHSGTTSIPRIKESRFNPDPDSIPESDHHVETAGLAHKHGDDLDRTPSPGRESSPSPKGRPRMHQPSLFDPDVIESPTKSEPKRDYAQEVFDHLAARIVATKTDLGIKPAIGPRILSKADRKNIEARIAEYDTPDEGVEACKRVIAVDEADCRRAGEISMYWNAATPFRRGPKHDNWENRLMRYRDDGRHVAFGYAGRSKPKTDHSFEAYTPEEDEIDPVTGEVIPGRKSMFAAVFVDLNEPGGEELMRKRDEERAAMLRAAREEQDRRWAAGDKGY